MRYTEEEPLLYASKSFNKKKLFAVAVGMVMFVGAIYYYNMPDNRIELKMELVPQEDYTPDSLSISHMTLTSAEQKEMLNAHNVKRCLHGVPPLTWNKKLYRDTVNTFDQQSQMKHSKSYDIPASKGGPAGENLYWASPPGTPTSAVNAWYEEINSCGRFPGCKAGSKGTTGHFTSMVWKDATQLACTRSKANKGLMACRYGTAGKGGCSIPNMGGCYTKEVQAPTKSESQCGGSAGGGGATGGNNNGGGAGATGGNSGCQGQDDDSCISRYFSNVKSCQMQGLKSHCSNKNYGKYIRKCCPDVCCF